MARIVLWVGGVAEGPRDVEKRHGVLRQVQMVEDRRRRMKMDAAMWNVVLFNLCEANGDLRELCAVAAYLEEGKAPADWEEFIEGRARKRGFGPSWFEVTMEHVYHHVNYAWNCRHAGAERATRCSMRDFNRWEKFPKDWPELWPSAERWEGKWPKVGGARLEDCPGGGDAAGVRGGGGCAGVAD